MHGKATSRNRQQSSCRMSAFASLSGSNVNQPNFLQFLAFLTSTTTSVLCSMNKLFSKSERVEKDERKMNLEKRFISIRQTLNSDAKFNGAKPPIVSKLGDCPFCRIMINAFCDSSVILFHGIAQMSSYSWSFCRHHAKQRQLQQKPKTINFGQQLSSTVINSVYFPFRFYVDK